MSGWLTQDLRLASNTWLWLYYHDNRIDSLVAAFLAAKVICMYLQGQPRGSGW